MRYLIITALFILLSLMSSTQNNLIKGKIIDTISGKAIKDVNIQVKGTEIGTSTNSKGYFELNLRVKKPILIISHINYENKEIDLKTRHDNYLNINILQKTSELDIFNVYANKVVDIIKDKPLYVKDYDFYGDSILLLVYRNKKISKPELVLINKNGDTLSNLHIEKPEYLHFDYNDNTFLVTKHNAYQIYVNKKGIKLLFPKSRDDFEISHKPVVEASGETMFFRKYFYKNQVLAYYAYELYSDKAREFKVIGEEQGLTMLSDFNRFMSMCDYNENALRFEELIMYDPVYAPLVKIGDTICIFNYLVSKLEKYSVSGNLLEEVDISFHKEKHWKEQIFVDEIKSKVYTLFKKNGITKIKEIDMKTGLLCRTIDVPDYQFIEKIKMRDDKLYFLYKDNVDYAYKKVYKMDI